MSRKRRGLLGRTKRPNRKSTIFPLTEPPERTDAPGSPEDAAAEPAMDAPEPTGSVAPTEPTPEVRQPQETETTGQPLRPVQADTIVPDTSSETLIPDEERAEPAEDPAPRTLEAGDVLGQWVIESGLGPCQQCSLYRARHKNTERIRVLLKVRFPDETPYPPDLVHEGELLFALKHPNVASVRNLKLTNDPPYLEMDELPGKRLDDMLLGQTIYMAQALDLVEQLLGALVYLHARGVFHRDIRPGNLVVRQDGGLSLMGFAYSIRDDQERRAPPSALGYLQPEWPEAQDPVHVDLYATGCLLFELLTGNAPFDAPELGSPLSLATVLRRKRSVPFLDPGERFHEDLRAIVRMLTSLEPRARFPSAATALGRLQRVDRSYAT